MGLLAVDRRNSKLDRIRGRDARATMGTPDDRVVDSEETMLNDAIRFLGQGHDVSDAADDLVVR